MSNDTKTLPHGPASVFARTEPGRHSQMTPEAYAAFLVLESGYGQSDAAALAGVSTYVLRGAVEASLHRLYPEFHRASLVGDPKPYSPGGHIARILDALWYGRWIPAAELPSGGCSRITTRTALHRLRRAGLVEARAEDGRPPRPGVRLTYRRTSEGHALVKAWGTNGKTPTL